MNARFTSWLISSYLIASAGAARATALGDLANAMSPGTFAELTGTKNWNNGDILLPLQYSGCVTGDYATEYANKAVWDARALTFRFVGSPHGNCSQQVFAIYDAVANTWSIGPQPLPGSGLKHSYDHNAIDPATGDHYHREYYSVDVHKWTPGASSWTLLPPIPMASKQCCGALEFFPTMGRLIFVDGGWGGWAYNPGTNAWTQLFRTSADDGSGLAQYSMVAYYNFAEYSNKGVLVFGGGSNVYKMDSGGKVTSLPSAPFGAVVVGSDQPCCSVVANPANGNILVINGSNQLWELNPTSGVWTQSSVTPPAFFGSAGSSLIAAPVSTYGVVMYVKCGSSSCQAHLYKSAATSPVTKVPDAPSGVQAR